MTTNTTVAFPTNDDVTIVGDLAVPDHPVGAAIVCHPHPQYGGNRYNNVVEALYQALPAAGFAALRFDFRSEFGGGVDEQLDAIAAIDHLDTALPDAPLVAIGYSFGAMVALALDDARIGRRALIAPPLGAMPLKPGTHCPTLVLSPAHDQFAPPDVAQPVVAEWPVSTFGVIDGADHFLTGQASAVAAQVVEWLTAE